MARYANIDHPAQLGGTARPARASHTFASGTAVGALLFLLCAVGSVVVRAAHVLHATFGAWEEQRRQRRADRRLWELALTDSRVMADLIAIRQDRSGEGR